MRKAVVCATVAPLFGVPEINSPLSDEVFHGMVVEVEEELKNGFCLVKTAYRYEGFVHRKNLCFKERNVRLWEESNPNVIECRYADVLSAPKVKGFFVRHLVKGCFVIGERQEENGFTKVTTVDGGGYVRTKLIGEPIVPFDGMDEEAFRARIVKTAESYLGAQYRWGGKTPQGIDCSGLAWVSYFLNGVIIYRDAKIMDGFPVKGIRREHMKKGDLIFFPGHVGIYAGDGKYIHSSSANDGVMVSALDSPEVGTITAIGSIY